MTHGRPWVQGCLQILRKLAPLLVPRLLSPLGINNFLGRFLASISAQVWRNITKNTKNADGPQTRKKRGGSSLSRSSSGPFFSQGALSNFVTTNSIFPQLALKVYGVTFLFIFTGLDVWKPRSKQAYDCLLSGSFLLKFLPIKVLLFITWFEAWIKFKMIANILWKPVKLQMRLQNIKVG